MDRTRTCTRCEITKAITDFPPAKRYRGGRNSRCRPCLNRAVLAIYYRRRAEGGVSPKPVYLTQEARRIAQAENKRRYAERHPARVRAAKRAYVALHPMRVKMTLAQNRARRRAAPGEVTAKQWKEILFFYGHRCPHCGIHDSERPLTVDHFIPIAKGGMHDWTNVWPLCSPCNLKKRDTMPIASAPPHATALVQTGT